MYNLYDIYLLLCIQYQTHDDGQRTYLKHVEFYSKNKFEKLVHLIGFIVRMFERCLNLSVPITCLTCQTNEKYIVELDQIFNPLKTKRRLLYLKTHSVPRSKYFSSRLQKPISYVVWGTSRCLFSHKYKAHKYSVGRAYSCWMLNCWCIT